MTEELIWWQAVLKREDGGINLMAGSPQKRGRRNQDGRQSSKERTEESIWWQAVLKREDGGINFMAGSPQVVWGQSILIFKMRTSAIKVVWGPSYSFSKWGQK
jgi:hypothetical protein